MTTREAMDDSIQQRRVTTREWLMTRQGVMTCQESLLLRVVQKVTTHEDPQLASFDLKSFILHSNKSQTPSMHQFKAKNMYETYKQQIKTLKSKNNKHHNQINT